MHIIIFSDADGDCLQSANNEKDATALITNPNTGTKVR